MEDRKKEKSKSSARPRLSWKLVLTLLIVAASVGAAGYYWNEAQNVKQQTPDGIAQRNQQETAMVIAALSDVLFLESDQEPTVARVEDPDVLKEGNPDFYKDTQVGDYLVLYPQRAIIFRLDEKRIVNIAPIVNTSEIQRSQQQSDQTEQVEGE